MCTPTINLLPWRQQYYKKIFIQDIMIFIFLSGFIALLLEISLQTIYFYLHYETKKAKILQKKIFINQKIILQEKKEQEILLYNQALLRIETEQQTQWNNLLKTLSILYIEKPSDIYFLQIFFFNHTGYIIGNSKKNTSLTYYQKKKIQQNNIPCLIDYWKPLLNNKTEENFQLTLPLVLKGTS